MKLSMVALSVGASVAVAQDSASTIQYFGAISARSASPIHLQEINAAGTNFWIGKETASYCPLTDSADCPAGNTTVFADDTASNSTTLSMAVEVPGGQQVYVAPCGALSYTVAHSADIPEGSIVTGFIKSEGSSFGYLSWGSGFVACPQNTTEGPWKVYAQREGVTLPSDCLGFDMLTANVTEIGAWEYT